MRRAHSRAGFTLLEIAVALAIAGVGIVSIMQVFSGSLRLQDRGARQSRAVIAARMGMDELLLRPTEDLKTGCGECRAESLEGFRMRCCVRDAGPEDGVVFDDSVSPDPILRALEVVVTWNDGAAEKTYTLHSMRLTPAPS